MRTIPMLGHVFFEVSVVDEGHGLAPVFLEASPEPVGTTGGGIDASARREREQKPKEDAGPDVLDREPGAERSGFVSKTRRRLG